MRTTLNPSVVVKSPKEILVGFTAAAAVEGDCWKEEVALVVSAGQTTSIDYKAYKKAYEKEFKADNNLKTMPGKYRSAKSVICKALDRGVELLDYEGYPRGKSEVEKDCKEPKTSCTPIDRCTGALYVLRNNIGKLDPVDAAIVKAALRELA